MNLPKYEDLTIQNDFMFKKVMQCKRICMKLISEIMQSSVQDITYLETEKTIDAYIDSRGVRLDVLLADENNTHYNIEMQVRDILGSSNKEQVLPKRTRYYQSIIDTDMLQKGQDYDELPPLVLIFICAFDLFHEGRYMYSFKSRCLENLELELQNGVSVLFLNTLGKKGDVSPLIKNFLQYVNDHVPKDDFTREVEEEVVRLKYDKEVRHEFMVLSTRLKEERMIGKIEGRKEGRKEKTIEVVINMLQEKMAVDVIAKCTKVSEEEIINIAKEEGIVI